MRKLKLAAILAACAAICLVPAACRANKPAGTPAASASPSAAPSAQPTSPALAQDGTLTLPPQLRGGERMLAVYIVESRQSRDMDAEEYLCGVLAGEMRNDWPAEALKAQAIIARTYLIDFLNSKGGSLYGNADISTDVKESQAFDTGGINDAIRKAVADTRGKVITYNGQAIKAWFHSCSGGSTALATEGLAYDEADPPYIAVVRSDESAAPGDALDWSASFSRKEIEAALRDMGLPADRLEPVSISQTGPSGRCVTLSFGNVQAGAADLRMRLDPTRFRSTLLTGCQWSDGSLKVTGKGYGHGVGMSQWGAYTMAANGASCEQIIAHYFKDVRIVKAWD